MRMNRLLLLTILGMALVVECAVPAWGESWSITVKIRAENDPNARLFFWYAEHGHTLKDEGFLVPVDAPPPTSPQFKLKAIHMRVNGGHNM